MKKNVRFTVACAVLAFSAALSDQASANLIVNGDFESGNTGFTSDYAYSAGNIVAAGVYDIVSDPSSVHGAATSYGDHTSGSGLMMAVNGSTTAGDITWSQTVSVLPGATYDFATYISSWTSGSPAALIFAINGTTIGALGAPSTTGVWDLEFATWLSDTTSATISIRNANTAFGGNDFALDDIYFGNPIFSDPDGGSTSVPEPAVLGLVALGLVAAAVAGRRRKTA